MEEEYQVVLVTTIPDHDDHSICQQRHIELTPEIVEMIIIRET
jgi:hypothetical protein